MKPAGLPFRAWGGTLPYVGGFDFHAPARVPWSKANIPPAPCNYAITRARRRYEPGSLCRSKTKLPGPLPRHDTFPPPLIKLP
jgi:hypothetical protein